MHHAFSIPGFADPVSCWTHLIGAVVFLCLSVLLVRQAAATSTTNTVCTALFGIACVFLLSMSGVYHLLERGETARYVFKHLDHAAIYVMIAATITAVHALLFRGVRRWGMILFAWIVSATAIVIKMIYFSNFPELLGLLSYLLFGWLGIVSGLAVWRQYGFRFVRPLLFGGLAYTFGAVLEYLQQPVLVQGVIGPHEVFHFAVLLGISYHWSFIQASMRQITAPQMVEA